MSAHERVIHPWSQQLCCPLVELIIHVARSTEDLGGRNKMVPQYNGFNI